jgi:hypothetical protein
LVPETELRGILAQLLEEFGGYTIAGEVEGGWRSPEGNVYRDRNTQIWLAIDRSRIAKLRRVLRDIGNQLGQEAMYLEIGTGSVEIVEVPQRRRKKKE